MILYLFITLLKTVMHLCVNRPDIESYWFSINKYSEGPQDIYLYILCKT